MIFVTTGYHTPFPRLLEAMDAFAAETGREVVMQAGGWTPKSARCACFPYADDLSGWFDKADVVVTAGGYTVLELLKRRRQFLVFPRLGESGEAIDDHQVEFAGKLRARTGAGFPVVTDASELPRALLAFRPFPYGEVRETLPALKAWMGDWLDGLRASGSR